MARLDDPTGLPGEAGAGHHPHTPVAAAAVLEGLDESVLDGIHCGEDVPVAVAMTVRLAPLCRSMARRPPRVERPVLVLPLDASLASRQPAPRIASGRAAPLATSATPSPSAVIRMHASHFRVTGRPLAALFALRREPGRQ